MRVAHKQILRFAQDDPLWFYDYPSTSGTKHERRRQPNPPLLPSLRLGHLSTGRHRCRPRPVRRILPHPGPHPAPRPRRAPLHLPGCRAGHRDSQQANHRPRARAHLRELPAQHTRHHCHPRRVRGQARYLRHHGRYRRHVAPRLVRAGVALPAFLQAGWEIGHADRRRHPPPEPLHPARPLRQCVSTLDNQQALELVHEGPYRPQTRRGRAQVGDRLALLPHPAGPRLLARHRQHRPVRRAVARGCPDHRQDLPRAATQERPRPVPFPARRVRTHRLAPARRLRQPGAARRVDFFRLPPIRRRLHLSAIYPGEPVRPALARAAGRAGRCRP